MSSSLTALLTSYLTSFFTSLAIFGGVYLLFWIVLAKPLAKRKIQLVKRAGREQVWREIRTTALATLGASVFIFGVLALGQNGAISIYEEFGRYGLGYELFQFLVLLFVGDAWFYWVHRLLHTPRLYKYVHALHHESLDVNPFTSNSFHFLEAILNTLFVLPIFLLMPISTTVLGVQQVLGLLNNLKSHLGYELYPGWFARIPLLEQLVTSTHHNLHHTQYNGNYGLFFNFWDRRFGTELKDTDSLFANIQTRKKVKVKNNARYRPLTITKLVRETPDTTSVYFAPEDKNFYDYLPGQFLNLRVKVNGRTHLRSFSLSSSPTEDSFLRITAKLNGEVTYYFHDQAKAGDKLEALYPLGEFTLTPHSDSSQNYLFVAGGSGITPLYSMLRTLLARQLNSKIALLYASRSKEHTIFYDELTRLQRKYPDRLEVRHFWHAQTRLAQTDITRALARHPDALVYLCGPKSLTDAAKKYAQAAGKPKADLYQEEYADGFVNLVRPKYWRPRSS